MAKLAVCAVALTGAVLGGGLVATELPAFADVTTNAYTIGAPWGAVSSVSASPATAGEGASTNFQVTFNVPSALSGTSNDWVAITPSTSLASAPPSSSVAIFGGSCIQAGTSGTGGPGSGAASGVMIELLSTCSLAAGQKVEVDFVADAPAVLGALHFTVTTSKNATGASSSNISVTTAGPQLAAGSVAFGANTTYSVSDVPVANLSSSQTTLKLSAGVTGGTEALTFYNGSAGYTVTYTPSGGSATADAVSGVALSSNGSVATLTLATALASGDVLNVTAKGTNPAPSVTSQSNNVTMQPGNGTAETTGSISFGQSVTALTVVPSSLVAGASSNYVISFKASDAVGAGGAIYLSETDEQTDFATVFGIEVTDTTQSWHIVATGSTLAPGSAKIPLSQGINAGDTVSLIVAGVSNPPAGTVSDFALYTSADSVPVDAAPYTIGASAGVNVSVSSGTAGSLASYTVSDLFANAALVGGSSTITIDAPAGTTFPNDPSDYAVQDATTPSGSGTVTAALAGGGSNDVTIKVPGNINVGDRLTLSVQDVINPSVASTAYTIGLVGNVTGPSTAAAPFPHAAATYPNGAIISFAGAEYVMAGGHAFGVGSAKDLTALERVDHAKAVASAAGVKRPSGAPRAGTLLFTRPVNGNATVYVVGTDGELHGFASPKQLKNDGYDAALVVTVPSLGGVTVGRSAGAEGSAGTALGTSSDGAIVDSSGTYYVFAGGRAFKISGSSELGAVQKGDKAKVVSGTVSSAKINAGIASGVELSAPGKVYVSYQGDLYPFKSVTQLRDDGYGGTAAVPVPGNGGLTVVNHYSGS